MLRHLQLSQYVRLRFNTESAYSVFILYNFRIASHPTNAHPSIHFIDPKQLYQCIYTFYYILSCRNEYIYSFPPLDKFINDLSVFSVLFILIDLLMPIDLRNYIQLNIYFVFCLQILSHFNFTCYFCLGIFCCCFLTLEQGKNKRDSESAHGLFLIIKML